MCRTHPCKDTFTPTMLQLSPKAPVDWSEHIDGASKVVTHTIIDCKESIVMCRQVELYNCAQVNCEKSYLEPTNRFDHWSRDDHTHNWCLITLQTILVTTSLVVDLHHFPSVGCKPCYCHWTWRCVLDPRWVSPTSFTQCTNSQTHSNRQTVYNSTHHTTMTKHIYSKIILVSKKQISAQYFYM